MLVSRAVDVLAQPALDSSSPKTKEFKNIYVLYILLIQTNKLKLKIIYVLYISLIQKSITKTPNYLHALHSYDPKIKK